MSKDKLFDAVEEQKIIETEYGKLTALVDKLTPAIEQKATALTPPPLVPPTLVLSDEQKRELRTQAQSLKTDLVDLSKKPSDSPSNFLESEFNRIKERTDTVENHPAWEHALNPVSIPGVKTFEAFAQQERNLDQNTLARNYVSYLNEKRQSSAQAILSCVGEDFDRYKAQLMAYQTEEKRLCDEKIEVYSRAVDTLIDGLVGVDAGRMDALKAEKNAKINELKEAFNRYQETIRQNTVTQYNKKLDNVKKRLAYPFADQSFAEHLRLNEGPNQTVVKFNGTRTRLGQSHDGSHRATLLSQDRGLQVQSYIFYDKQLHQALTAIIEVKKDNNQQYNANISFNGIPLYNISSRISAIGVAVQKMVAAGASSLDLSKLLKTFSYPLREDPNFITNIRLLAQQLYAMNPDSPLFKDPNHPDNPTNLELGVQILAGQHGYSFFYAEVKAVLLSEVIAVAPNIDLDKVKLGFNTKLEEDRLNVVKAQQNEIKIRSAASKNLPLDLAGLSEPSFSFPSPPAPAPDPALFRLG